MHISTASFPRLRQIDIEFMKQLHEKVCACVCVCVCVCERERERERELCSKAAPICNAVF